MIDLYDGNNVMRRATEQRAFGPPAMTLRQRYEEQCSKPEGSQIWVWDGYGHNDRRKAIYPKYKSNRVPAAEDIFSQIRLFRDVLTHAPVHQFDCNGWEADDVIGTLAHKYAEKRVPVTIHTNDMDYAQLLRLPNVTLNGVNLKGIEPRWVCLYKALVGDTSDAIAGLPNFGPKTWGSLEEWWPQIERAIAVGDPQGFVDIPFKPAQRAWLLDPENVKLLQSMLQIVYMAQVPDDELNGGYIECKLDRQTAHNKLKEFLL